MKVITKLNVRKMFYFLLFMMVIFIERLLFIDRKKYFSKIYFFLYAFKLSKKYIFKNINT